MTTKRFSLAGLHTSEHEVDMEMVGFQKDGFRELLVNGIGEMLLEYASGSPIRASLKSLDKMIKDRTGLNVNLNIVNNTGLNAWVWIPNIDHSHPLYTGSVAHLTDGDITKMVDEGQMEEGKMSGGLDPRNGKVYGVFSEVPFKICVTLGLLKAFMDKPAMLAAVIWHECGHAYSTLAMVGHNHTTNFALATAARAISETDDTVFINDVLFATGRSVPKMREELNEIAKVEGIAVKRQLLIGAATREILSIQSSPLYDRRAAEHFSDMYAARFGMGKDLIEALDYMYTAYGVDLKKSSQSRFISGLVGFLAVVLFAPIAIPMVMMTVAMDPLSPRHVYGSTRERMEAVQNQMVEHIKELRRTKPVDQELINKAVEDYEDLQKIVEKYRDYRDFIEWLSDIIHYRKQRPVSDMQRRLERLNSNGLFVKAAKLEGIL